MAWVAAATAAWLGHSGHLLAQAPGKAATVTPPSWIPHYALVVLLVALVLLTVCRPSHRHADIRPRH